MLALIIVFGSSCSKGSGVQVNTIGDAGDSSQSAIISQIPEVTFPESPKAGTGTNADASITLNGNSIAVEGSGARVSGSTVTITAAGTYKITGTLNDGQVIVNTLDKDKVKLILNGVKITCSDSSPVYVIGSPNKTVIYLQEGSVNILEDGSVYDSSKADPSTDAPAAAIFSMDDLKLEGSGELYVTGNYNKGIFTKDDLEIEGGSIYVKASDDGIRGKDSITMTGGAVYIDAGADGLRTSNETDKGKGNIQVDGGALYIKAEQDAVQSVGDIGISSGKIVIYCGGGSDNSSSKANTNTGKGWGSWSDKKRPGQNNATPSPADGEETPSAKGIKASGAISISGGSFTIDSSDDAIHSSSDVSITGGSLYISSGDDGIHGDNSLEISGGVIQIVKSYEGLEAFNITISGGTNRVTSIDDGINAAGGSDSSSVNGRPGQNRFASSENGMITITGGYTVVNASGDGIDSNGNMEMSGGTVIVYGPTDNRNGALDYNGTFNLTGGYLLAIGSSGMAQSPKGNGQSVMVFTLSMDKDTLLHIQDSSGKEVLTVQSPKSYSCVVFSSPSLKSGEAYTVYYGGSYSSDGTDGIYSGGKYTEGTKLGELKL